MSATSWFARDHSSTKTTGTDAAIAAKSDSAILMASVHPEFTPTWGDPFRTPEFTRSITSYVSDSISLSSGTSHDGQVPSLDFDPFLASNSSTLNLACFPCTAKLPLPPHDQSPILPLTDSNNTKQPATLSDVTQSTSTGSLIKSLITSNILNSASGGTRLDAASEISHRDTNSPNDSRNGSGVDVIMEIEDVYGASLSDNKNSASKGIIVESSIMYNVPTSASSGINMLLDAACVISQRDTDSPTDGNRSGVEVFMDIDDDHDGDIYPGRYEQVQRGFTNLAFSCGSMAENDHSHDLAKDSKSNSGKCPMETPTDDVDSLTVF
ncbi:uncharacterized protein MELLADRAFT_114425 [Melampsora larici-populina 98AG31]|uniref:Uncharacterized protein n=1 Tax=Melampsora larici-populina (strain 98AG31 / pathotype 3-4-7) TaxID=747676 RepID=F4SDE6_MELLP|nr:uncharacterized protein MELLADRAFT_114425 [Melampsora larici-populina 98AG31]EGF97328.1 hypothetical protein MELLADRAFT_114425 [Melampsora larici-populina 98AG31]